MSLGISELYGRGDSIPEHTLLYIDEPVRGNIALTRLTVVSSVSEDWDFI